MPTIHLKAHFDGHAIQLDEPAELPCHAPLEVTVLLQAPLDSERDVEPLSEARRADIEAWIENATSLAAGVEASDGPRLQAAVTEIRRQARELARRGAETSP